MARKRPRSSARQPSSPDEDVYDDFDEDANTSFDRRSNDDDDIAYTSNIPPTNASISSTAREEIIAETIKLAFACEESKIPLKRTAICSDIIASRAIGLRSTDVYKQVFPDIQKKLHENFGMQLVAIPEPQIPSAMRTVKPGKQREDQTNGRDGNTLEPLPDPMKCDALMLSSSLPTEYRRVIVHPRPAYERSFMGIAFIIVTLLILNGGWVKKTQLETDFLPKIGFTDSIGGDTVDNLLSKLKERRYLVSRKVLESESDQPKEFYCLGQRALKEFTIDGLGYMLEKMYSDDGFDAMVYTQAIGKLKDAPLRHLSEFMPLEHLNGQETNEQNNEL